MSVFNILPSESRKRMPFLYKGSLFRQLLRYVVPFLVIGWVTVESKKVTMDWRSNDICPCLPMDKCPRIYGQSAHDIRELGFLEPCHQFGTVRCCGVTIRVEHEKDSERNWDDLIGSVKTKQEMDTTFHHQRTNNIINTKRDLQGVDFSTNLTKTTVEKNLSGVSESWLPTSGNPLMKFRRRKLNVSKKGFRTTNGDILSKDMKTSESGDLSTGGGSTLESIDASFIKSNSSSSSTFTTSTQNGDFGLTPQSHFQKMTKKLVGKITELHGGEEPTTSGSKGTSAFTTSMTSSASSKINPVFSRIRKPMLKVGIKVDANLPITTSIIKTKTFSDKNEKMTLKPESVQNPFKTVLNLGINLEKEPVKGSLLSTSSHSIELGKMNSESGTQIIKTSRTQSNSFPRVSTSSRITNSLLTKKIRPISINNRLTSSNSNITQISIHSHPGSGIRENQNLKSKTFFNSNSKSLSISNTNSKLQKSTTTESIEKVENTGNLSQGPVSSHVVSKLRRPGRPIIQRRPFSSKLSIKSPDSLIEVTGSDLISTGQDTTTIKTEKETITLPPVLKHRNRIRIHRISTTTSTTSPIYKKFKTQNVDDIQSRTEYKTLTNQSPASIEYLLTNATLYKQEKNEEIYPERDHIDEETILQSSPTKDPSYHYPFNSQETHIVIETSTTLPSMQIKEPEPLSYLETITWEEQSTNPSQLSSVYIHDDSTESIPMTTMSTFGNVESGTYQRPSNQMYSHHKNQNDEIEQLQTYTTSAPLRKRKKPLHLTSTYTRNRHGLNNPSSTTSTMLTNPKVSLPNQSNHMSKPSHRFQIPINFDMIPVIDEPIQTSKKTNYKQEDSDWAPTSENYDIILDKESREYLKSNPIPVNSSPELNSHINYNDPRLTNSESLGYNPDQQTSDVVTESSDLSSMDEEEVEAETRIHIEFIEKTSPAPILSLPLHPFMENVNKQGKIKYRRIPVQKTGDDRWRAPESTSSSPSVNIQPKITIINSQKMEQIPTRFENILSQQNQNVKSKRVKVTQPLLLRSSTPVPSSFDTTSEKFMSKFTFPPFTRQNILETTISPVTRTPTKFNSNKIGFRLTPKPTSTSTPSVSSTLPQTRVRQARPTVSFLAQQILPTEIPFSSTILPITTPMSYQQILSHDNENKHLGSENESKRFESKFLGLRPTNSQSARFTVPQIFNFTETFPRRENLGFSLKLPKESPPTPTFTTNEVRVNSNLNPNLLSTLSHPYGERHQIIQNENNEKTKFIQFPLSFEVKKEKENPLSPSNSYHLQSSLISENPGTLISTTEKLQIGNVGENLYNQYQNLYFESSQVNNEHPILVSNPKGQDNNIQTLYTKLPNQEKLQTYINVNNNNLPFPPPSSPLQSSFISKQPNLLTKEPVLSSNETFPSEISKLQPIKFNPSIQVNENFKLPPTLHSPLALNSVQFNENPEMGTYVMRPEFIEPVPKSQPMAPSSPPQNPILSQSQPFLGTPLFQIYSSRPTEFKNFNENIYQGTQTKFRGEQPIVQSNSYGIPNQDLIQNGHVTQTQGGRVVPVTFPKQILRLPFPSNQNQQQGSQGMTPVKTGGSGYRQYENYEYLGQGSPRPLVQYSSNQFNPYRQSGSPIQFTSSQRPQLISHSSNVPHYIKEYHQHHAISKQILDKLQNSVRTSRSTNLTSEEINSLLEISDKYSLNENFLTPMELEILFLQKLNLKKENKENVTKVDESNSISQIHQNRTTLTADALNLKVKERNQITGDIEAKNSTEGKLLESNERNHSNISLDSIFNSTDTPTLTYPEKVENRERIFQAPKTIQRGFLPILVYSEKDPGPMMVNLRVNPNERTSRGLVDRPQEKVLISLTRQ